MLAVPVAQLHVSLTQGLSAWVCVRSLLFQSHLIEAEVACPREMLQLHNMPADLSLSEASPQNVLPALFNPWYREKHAAV
jgi:hypothetical protein